MDSSAVAAKKRKYDSETSDSSNPSEASESPVKAQVHKKKAKKASKVSSKKGRKASKKVSKEPQKKSKTVASDSDASDTDNLLPVIMPKPQGCPPKSEQDVKTRRFAVPVYVEVAQLPVLKRGKTFKGDRYVKQPATAEGPFTISQKTTWNDFLAEVAEVAGINAENINASITSMTWSFQKKNPLPLTGTSGFKTMVQQIKVLKDPESAIILVTLLVPRHRAKE